MYQYESDGQMTMLELESDSKENKRSKRRMPKPDSDLIAVPYYHLNMSPGHVDIFGCHYWELRSPYRVGKPPLNTGVAPRKPIRVSLADILEPNPDPKYYLSKTACLGILRRAEERGKELPVQLKIALMIQAGLMVDAYVTSEVKAFAANQRDEVRDLHNVAGALGTQPGMKQQTFVASFSAGAGASAGGIGYSKEITPTLKGTASGNCMPTVLCLNDQGGRVMECSEDKVGTLRAQEHGHQSLVLPLEEFGPLLFENHGIDSRYTGPHEVAPTMSARYGTGGNNVPLVSQEVETYCIMGNAIDREPHNGGNGIGYQEGVAYTLTATDHHAVFSRQRVDVFCENDVVSTQSARQHKDATDLVWQNGNQMSKPECDGGADENAPAALLIRRLTPLECERLQAFPDFWTEIQGASDSARYKALGNSVAIPCVEFIMEKIADDLDQE